VSDVILASSTHPRWFFAATGDLQALLSDHLHCERKAAENALSLVRRYPHRGGSVEALGRLAHEETSHVIQVAALLSERGWSPRADLPNQYARALLAEVRGREPERLLDALLVAAFIEERSHERLSLLATGFDALASEQRRHAVPPRIPPGAALVNAPAMADLAGFYHALATAEERHARIFLDLAAPLVPAAELSSRLAYLAMREAEILADQPHLSRVH
jgi:tRNA 2-(methylsulfanyl)-N6-isopentenyladenosine37 hydroxylase